MPSDPRYQAPVGNMAAEVLPTKLKAAIADLERQFPGLGLTLFVFDFGPSGGMSYISNAERADMVRALREFLRKQSNQS